MLFDGFVKDREHPNHWYNRANDLKAAAGVLSFSMEGKRNSIKEYIGVSPEYSLGVACLNSYYLLCGLSIEALLKYKISLLSDKAVQFNTHTLLSIVEKLNIPMEKSDRLKLEYLTLYVVWGGKYPYPKKNTVEQWERLYNLHEKILCNNSSPRSKIQDDDKELMENDPLGWKDFVRIWALIEISCTG